MEAEIVSKFAYVITAVSLSFIAASFYAFGANIVLEEQRFAAQYFRNFFLLIGFAFITYALATSFKNPISIGINNIVYVTSFCCLRMGFASRFGYNPEARTAFRKELLLILFVVLTLNCGVFLYIFDSSAARSGLIMLVAIYYCLNCVKYVKEGDKRSGEWASKVSLMNTIFLMLALLVVVIMSGRSFYFITALLLAQSLLVVMFFGSTLVLFLSDTSAKFQRESVTDFLTSLFNRRYFESRLNEIVHSAQRQLTPAALIIIDIDYFKHVNDNYGHDAGDKVLKQIADIIKESVRVSDIASRFGGEEFCILLPHTDANGAMIFANRMRESIEGSTIHWRKQIIQVTASFGVHEIDVEESPETALRKADSALYISKNAGRNRVTQYNKNISELNQEVVL